MIADSFTAFDPAALGDDFAAAFAALQKMNGETPVGRHDVSERVYINVMEYDASEPWNPMELEAHREYADIQVVLAGKEAVAWAYNDGMPVTREYNAESDVLFQKADPLTVSKLELVPGLFAIFFPQDGHYGKFAPASGAVSAIRKAVAKVKLN